MFWKDFTIENRLFLSIVNESKESKPNIQIFGDCKLCCFLTIERPRLNCRLIRLCDRKVKKYD